MKKLNRDVFAGKNAIESAKYMIGKLIVKITPYGMIVARIIEDEAYAGIEDKASSSYAGNRLTQNNVLFGEPGFIHVANINSLVKAFCIVTCQNGNPSYTLVRKLEILEGFDAAGMARFGKKYADLSDEEKTNLSNSANKVREMLGINDIDNGTDLCNESSKIWLSEDDTLTTMYEIKEEKRLGVENAGEYADKPWRFIYQKN